MRRRLWLVALAVALSEPVASQAPTSYVAEGRNPDGSAYTARVELVEEGRQVRLVFYTPDNQLSAVSMGLRDGTAMATIFPTRDSAGVALYRLEGDQWISQWFVVGEPGLGVEILTPFDPKLHGAELGPKSAL